MQNVENICLLEDALLRDAIEVMNESGRQIILIIDQDKKLLGTFTDGDLRRSLMTGADLKTSIKNIYNKNPLTSPAERGRAGAVEMMREHGIDQMPLIKDGRVVGIEAINPSQYGIKVHNTVVFMAGGLGKRLYPITETIPKALVPIGSRPILEIILERVIAQGFQKFIFTVNHLGDMIEDYFGDGSRWNVSITYIREEQRLGTAGGLSLIDDLPKDPMLILNCDVLTTTDFQDMIQFHEKTNSILSMGVQEHYHQIPYGVVQMDGTKLIKIVEKPETSHHVNAGMYVISPDVISHIPKNEFFDMTSLVEDLIEKNQSIHCYPAKKFWIDIGNPKDLESARSEYHLHF